MRRYIAPTTIAVAAVAVILSGCEASTPAPTATVTVTATPSATPAATVAETSTPPVAAEAAEPDQGPISQDPGMEDTTSPTAAKPVSQSESVRSYLQQDAPQLFVPDSIVNAVTLEDDDVIIEIRTGLEANATQTYAPIILRDATTSLRAHSDDPAVGSLDLVVVRTPDGGIASMDQIVPHPQYAVPGQ